MADPIELWRADKPNGPTNPAYVALGAEAGSVARAGTPSAPFVVSSLGTPVEVEWRRPADATAYTAKDVVGPTPAANLLLPSMAREAGGSGTITLARFFTDRSACIARFRLHLYNLAPSSPIADNSPFTLLWGNRKGRIGVVDVPALGTEGTGSDAASQVVPEGAGNLPLDFVCGPGSRDLYMRVEVLDADAPNPSQQYYAQFFVRQD